jgi:hypothetical protein
MARSCEARQGEVRRSGVERKSMLLLSLFGSRMAREDSMQAQQSCTIHLLSLLLQSISIHPRPSPLLPLGRGEIFEFKLNFGSETKHREIPYLSPGRLLLPWPTKLTETEKRGFASILRWISRRTVSRQHVWTFLFDRLTHAQARSDSNALLVLSSFSPRSKSKFE